MKIGSIILRTDNVDATASFWSEKVGLVITNAVPGYTFLDGGSVSLLIAHKDEEITDTSLTEIVILSDDVRSDFVAMAERGVPFESDLGAPIMSRDGKDMVAAHFQDPDGHYGRLTGWVPSE